MCDERRRLESDFIEAVARCTAALNEQLHVVINGDSAAFAQSDSAIADATKERRRAKSALLEHIAKYDC